MMEFLRAGGFSMWVILAFGLVDLVAAVLFARRPEVRKLGPVSGLAAATLFSVCAGTAACLGAVFFKVPANPEWAHSPDLHLIVMQGLGESMTPAILGFSLLSLVALVVAVGLRRMPRAT